MNRRPSKRITLALPSECLDRAERIARQRRLSLSTVIGEALQRGLREEKQIHRIGAIQRFYSEAFAGFSPDELQLLDGIVRGQTLETPSFGKKDIR